MSLVLIGFVEATQAVPAAPAPAGRKGIRDSNAKGNEVRGSNRGGGGQGGWF
jgi:hypothetical protein